MEFDKRLAELKERLPSLSFDTPEGKDLARVALTHSSASATRNNTELSKVGEMYGKAVATKALYLSPGRHSGKQYNDITMALAGKNLSRLAKELKLEDALRLGKGVPFISEEMYARALLALVGAIELSQGAEALEKVLRDLGIIKDVAPLPESED
ncbi:hypothetical protein JCM10207_000919 [Rhodosporidiobolus poonsookiae]